VAFGDWRSALVFRLGCLNCGTTWARVDIFYDFPRPGNSSIKPLVINSTAVADRSRPRSRTTRLIPFFPSSSLIG